MDTSRLKKFAQYARRSLIEQVQSKLKLVLTPDSAARREHPQAVKALEEQQKQLGDDEQLVEQVAYTWFNRFCALRFMDANQYNRIMVISPLSGQFQPEILAEAKAGHLDDSVFNEKTSEQIRGLLTGSIPSHDGQAEAFRLMVVAVCNDYHRLMPYLFERIEDYTELLMPDDLLSGNSILAYTREAMTPENCESVESIGWLYQFYISEKKDQVFEGLKKNKKITPENIPAATQLFTPHWIVKYLVENSLGRLWMLNNPNSKVIEQMEYYIKPVEDEVDFLKVGSPEELKLCDPAAGSGHMLTYAYDLLYAIYLDANYDPVDIPELILTKNLYGIEIDERAAELAAFALSMKAIKGNPTDDSNNRRRFFRKPIKPNICRLEKVKIDESALAEYIEFAGRELFTQDVIKTLSEFEEADNFGSLIQPTLKNPEKLLATLKDKDAQVDLFLKDTHESILRILKQAKYLSPIYQVVTANPPYMGGSNMNPRLKVWVKDNYKDGKADLFAAFMERSIDFLVENGFVAMINMQSWMFLSAYENFRKKILSQTRFVSMAHLGERAFDSIGGAVVTTTSFVLEKSKDDKRKAVFLRLTDGQDEKSKDKLLRQSIGSLDSSIIFHASSTDFNRIPGNLIAYWLSDEFIKSFRLNDRLGSDFTSREGLTTGSNDKFLRLWFEVSLHNTVLPMDDNPNGKWFAYQKGGDYRKWSGNSEYLVDWEYEGQEILSFADEKTGRIRSHNYNGDWAFKPGLTWSSVSGENFSVRNVDGGYLFDTTGSMGFVTSDCNRFGILSFLNSCVASAYMKVLSPAIRFQPGHALNLPFNKLPLAEAEPIAKRCIQISELDWSSLETSWDFKASPLLEFSEGNSVKTSFETLQKEWKSNTLEMKKLEEQNNAIFIKAYNLQSELTSDVSIEKVTLNGNPYYKLGKKLSAEELDYKQKQLAIIDFLSYSVGCMFGRYSLDESGLILAAQRSTLENYLKRIPNPTFRPDDDNVVPIIDFDGDWFEDDITERFKTFLKVTFGEESLAENLRFIEEAIGKDIKKYFVKDFYADHVKRYKKRPIYWMFSSPKGSFNALIYMHRYQPDTASIVLNDYLREFRIKLEARKESYEQVEISASASQKEKTQAIKAITKINKVLEEVNDYEHDVLYPLAGEKIEIDLDDGVKHNYPLFGKALKKVTGLS